MGLLNKNASIASVLILTILFSTVNTSRSFNDNNSNHKEINSNLDLEAVDELIKPSACTVSSVEIPFDSSDETEPTLVNYPELGSNQVNLKILHCFNVSLATLNQHYFGDPAIHDVYYKEIYLEQIENHHKSVPIKVAHENQTETFEMLNSHLSDNQLMQLFSAKHNFVNLRILNLSGNQITKLKRELFNKSTRLRVLNLSKNSIDNLIHGVFDDLVALSKLYLNNNHLMNLTNGELFGNLRQLSVLDLSNNNINDLPRHVFNGLSNLIQLNLAHNKLYVIPFQVFRELRSIEILDLSHNVLISFLDNFFVMNKRLKVLKLHHNIIEKVAKNSLYGLKELHTLDISSNQLALVDRNAFDTLEELKYLNLANNKIYVLSANVFLALKQLRIIELSRNLMRTLPLGIFASQYQLNEIHLDNTHLETVSNWITRVNTNTTINKNILKNLKYLSMRNNSKLREIESCVFQNTPSIERLYLNGNNLTYLPNEIGELRQLQELDVSKNALQFIPVGIKDLANLRMFNLLGNDLHCDCRMYWMLSWIEQLQAKNKTLLFELLRLSELKCKHGYPGDIMRVLQHINCVKPYLYHKSESKQHLLKTDAILECSFAGNPAPEIYWTTPYGEILRYNEHAESNPYAKLQLEQIHDSIGDTLSEKKYQEIGDAQMLRSDNVSEQLRTGPGITLLENGILRINNISRTDAGPYTCYAINIMGNSTTFVR